MEDYKMLLSLDEILAHHTLDPDSFLLPPDALWQVATTICWQERVTGGGGRGKGKLV